MKILLTLLALGLFTLSARADITEGVKSWLKDQGCVIKANYHLAPIAVEDIKKHDIVEFDKDGENQYGIVWADPEKDSDVIAVDVGGMSTQMFVLVPIKKTDIKGAVRCVEGSSTFVMPTHQYAFLGPLHRRTAVLMPTRPPRMVAVLMPTHPSRSAHV